MKKLKSRTSHSKKSSQDITSKSTTVKNTPKAILLVILCTFLTSTGQILWKLGANNMSSAATIFHNWPLLLGYLVYGLGAGLLIGSLKYGDLSMLYPFVSLSFVWVNIASIFIFGEFVSILNWVGITSILIGVSLIGYGSSK